MNHGRSATEQLKNIKQERKKKKAQHTLFVNDMLDQGQLRGEKKSQSDYEKALKVCFDQHLQESFPFIQSVKVAY